MREGRERGREGGREGGKGGGKEGGREGGRERKGEGGREGGSRNEERRKMLSCRYCKRTFLESSGHIHAVSCCAAGRPPCPWPRSRADSPGLAAHSRSSSECSGPTGAASAHRQAGPRALGSAW